MMSRENFLFAAIKSFFGMFCLRFYKALALRFSAYFLRSSSAAASSRCFSASAAALRFSSDSSLLRLSSASWR